MVDNLVGKWKCISNENMNEFLEKMNVGFMVRKVITKKEYYFLYYNNFNFKIAANMKPTLTITFNNGVWTIKSEATVKTTVHTFEVDKEFEEETPDGKKVKSSATISGQKMIHTQLDKNGNINCIISREVDKSGQQIVIFHKDGVEGKRVFERV